MMHSNSSPTIDPVVVVNTADLQPSESASASPLHAPPSLRGSERHHVFVSYSSTDDQWAHSIISQLEFHGLRVCYHERDFLAGRTVLENMSECIQGSQKVLLILSQEFVRSRWCLLEANMSLFRDCLERKPIIPVLLDPEVSIPLHLCHLTYLNATDPNFMNKLLTVLCTPNQQLQGSTVAPFQPPTIYNGKVLQPLIAVDEEELNGWESGHFNDMDVPDQLRLIIEDRERYRQAMRIVNRVADSQLLFRPLLMRALLTLVGFILPLSIVVVISVYMVTDILTSNETFSNVPVWLQVMGAVCFILGGSSSLIYFGLWKRDKKKEHLRELRKACGEANKILSEEKVLIGCVSNSKMSLVYVSLDGCKREFEEAFSAAGNTEVMFKKALTYFSSGYACCLAKRHFPFSTPGSGGHLEGGVCFCQYVAQQLDDDHWE